jgi:tetratricopeptide (TPR) repeat protein
MKKCARRSAILYFFAFFWMLAAAAPVFGGGNRDPDLARADSLINEKRYDEAILLLSDYARRHPDRFDHAQERFKKIYNIREEFNRTADELIYTLLNDPDNSEKVLELSLRLRELEDETSPLIRSFIARTQELAEFNVNRNRLREILIRGRELLDNGESEAALLVYSGGLGFMREHFFASGYGEDIEREVLSRTNNVNSIISRFRNGGANLDEIMGELIRALNSGNLTAVSGIMTRLRPMIDDFIGLKQELYASVNSFDRILDGLRAADPEMGDRNHLAFVTRVIHGRNDQVQEGMLGAFEVYWKNTVSPVISVIMRNAETYNTTGLTAFNAGSYSNAAAAMDRVESFLNFAPYFFEKRIALGEGDEVGRNRVSSLLGINVMNEDLQAYARMKSLSEAGKHLKMAAELGGRMNINRASFDMWQAGTVSATDALNNERRTRNAIAAINTSAGEIIASANQVDFILSAYQETVYIKDAVNAIENFRSIASKEEEQSLFRYYSIANNDLQRSISARTQELERGRNLLEGRSRQNNDGSVIVDHFPGEALETLTTMLSALANDLQRGNSVVSGWNSEPAPLAAGELLSAKRTDSIAIVSELNALRAQGLSLSETARRQMSQGEAFRRDGERLFREAQDAFQRQEFDVARERLQRSSDRFLSALDIQESASLRQSWDTQLYNLGQAINRAENEMIIAEVRTLVNNARATYFEGDFQQAEDYLVRARSRWRITNPDENEEVARWLTIVRSAMSARSGRVIPSTAPLFPEMSQLLSQAQKNYEEGVRFINAGQRAQGLAKFDEARQLTREVKLMFPLNQEAGILELRMEQFTDPAAFSAAFEQRLAAARDGTRQRSMESFADLQNLAVINPRYPNIRAIVTQAEIDMGLRPPPPNPRDLARSRELTASATRILEGSVTSLYEVALANINEAIALNPENAEATRVKDRLLNRMSVPSAVVLNSQDEDEYQRAVRELQAGNNLVARAIVERLMQNPRNRNITKLIELQRRIQSVL